MNLEAGIPVLAYRVKTLLPDGGANLVNGAMVTDGKLLTGTVGI